MDIDLGLPPSFQTEDSDLLGTGQHQIKCSTVPPSPIYKKKISIPKILGFLYSLGTGYKFALPCTQEYFHIWCVYLKYLHVLLSTCKNFHIIPGILSISMCFQVLLHTMSPSMYWQVLLHDIKLSPTVGHANHLCQFPIKLGTIWNSYCPSESRLPKCLSSFCQVF